MSQIPYNQPLIGPMQFTPQMFQGMPTNLPPAFQPVVGVMASILLTKALEQAHSNPARMSAFNHLVVNNFNNTNLPSTVELAIRIAIQKAMVQNNTSSVGNYFPAGADEALLYLTSSIMVGSPDIQRGSTQQAIQAAFQNNSNFARVHQELMNINLNAIGNQSQQPSSQMSTTAPIFSNYQPSFAGNQQTAQPNQPAVPSFGSHWSSNGAVAPPTPVETPTLKQGSFFNNEITKEAQRAQAPVPAPIPVVDFNKSAPVSGAIEQIIPVVTVKGENEMDVKSHAVPYFGSSDLLLDLSARRSDLQLESLQLHREATRPETVDAPILLNKSLLMEINLESALFVMNVSMNQNLFHGSMSKVYRQFLLALNPIACSEPAKDVMKAVVSAPSLNRLPDIFKAFLKMIKDPTNPKEFELLVLNFYAYIDGKLTKALNEFLAYNLRLPAIQTTSFCEAYPHLESYLLNTRGNNYAQALSVWGQRFFDQLKTGYQQNSSEVIDNYFDSDSKINYGIFPVYHSVTMLSLTRKELDYTVDDKGSSIDPKTTQILDSLTQGLFRNKKELDIPTSCDWLVTADDYRFRLAEDALNPGHFFMFKA